MSANSLTAAAGAVRDRLRAEVASRRAAEAEAEAKDLAYAKAKGQPMGDTYWHARHYAEQRLRAADGIVAALASVEEAWP